MKNYNLLILKPDALERELVGKIISRFVDNGFTIEMIDYRKVNMDLILKHYKFVIERMGNNFITMVENFFVGKFVILIIVSIENEDAISLSRRLVGVTDPVKSDVGTIRYDFGDDSLEDALKEQRCVRNLIHSSDNPVAFKRELSIWSCEHMFKKYSEGGNYALP